MSEITEEMIYIAFTEGRYGTHISKWAHTPFEGCIAYTRAASQASKITEEMRDEAYRNAKLCDGDHASTAFECGWDAAVAAMRAASPDQTNGLLREALEAVKELCDERGWKPGERAWEKCVTIEGHLLAKIDTALASTPTARIEESELTSEALAEKNVDGMDVIEGIVADAAAVEGIQNVHEGASYYAERVIRRAIEQGTLRATAEAVRRNIRETPDHDVRGLVERSRFIGTNSYRGSAFDIEVADALESLAAENARMREALEIAIAALGRVNTRCFDRPESPLKPVGDIAREALTAICATLGDTIYDALAGAALASTPTASCSPRLSR